MFRPLITAVEVDVADIATIVDVALERQVGHLIVAVAERTIRADAIRAVTVGRHPAAAREAANADAARPRSDRRKADDPACGLRHADQRAEDAGERSPVVQPALD